MVVEYRGNWKSGDFTVLKHYDYDEHGRLLKFKNQFDRLDFLDKNYKKAINLDKKDYKNLWECALAINKIVKIGELDFSIDDGELTPTLKIRRKQINDNWASVIEDLYSE